MSDLTDPKGFFECLMHDLGTRAKPEYLAYRPGETVLKEGDHVRRMLIVRHGEIAASAGGKTVCTYIANPRFGALPILSASDYCYSAPSSYCYDAVEHAEIVAIDTRVLIDMGRRKTILVLLRNMVLFSDMGSKLREKIAEEFERTGMFCFDPDLPEDMLLRMEPVACEEYYLDFALRTMAELTMSRICRSEQPSTAITALERPSWMTSGRRRHVR